MIVLPPHGNTMYYVTSLPFQRRLSVIAMHGSQPIITLYLATLTKGVGPLFIYITEIAETFGWLVVGVLHPCNI